MLREKIKSFFTKVLKWIIAIIVLLLLVRIFTLRQKSSFWNETLYKITDKSVKDWLYMIYTDKWTWVIEDSDIYMQYRSSDIYGSTEVWKCYRILKQPFTYRYPYFSMYPNIIKSVKTECK